MTDPEEAPRRQFRLVGRGGGRDKAATKEESKDDLFVTTASLVNNNNNNNKQEGESQQQDHHHQQQQQLQLPVERKVVRDDSDLNMRTIETTTTTTTTTTAAAASRHNSIFALPKGRKEKMKSSGGGSSSSSNYNNSTDSDVLSSTRRGGTRRRNRRPPQSGSSSTTTTTTTENDTYVVGSTVVIATATTMAENDVPVVVPERNISKDDSDLWNTRAAETPGSSSSSSGGGGSVAGGNNNNLFSFGRPRANSDPDDIISPPKHGKRQQQQQQQTRKSTNDVLVSNGGDWMRKFRRRMIRKKRTGSRRGGGSGDNTAGLLEDVQQLEQSDDADGTPRGVSWHSNLSSDAESAVSMPNDFLYHRRKDSFDSTTDSAVSMPHPILKPTTTTAIRRAQRPKPKLMDDPTHKPITTYQVPSDLNRTRTTTTTTKPSDNEVDDAENEWSFSSSDDDDISFDAEQLPDVLLTSSTHSMPRASGQRARYSVYHGNSKVKRKLRVRPYHRFPQGKYMTEEEIYADSLKPSQWVVELKSYVAPTSNKLVATKAPTILPEVEMLYGSPSIDGRIGALRAEVLGCVSLARTKPDIAVYMVCGDCAFCTDVISGYRSPMWPCETRRAAVFPLHHAYVQLFVGVFDVRVRKNKENDVFCGRVALDIASLRPDTEYDVTLPLRASTFVYDRRKRGVIRLRFSLHWFSERAAVISYFKPAKSISKSSPFVEGQPTIPCADPKTFRNVAVTVYGQDLPGKYSRNAFRASMREFNLYQQNLRIILQYAALDAILYERVPVSLYLFCAGMYCCLTSSIHMIPPFFVGYILIRYLENYNFYVQQTEYNFGYKPLTLLEVFNALLDKPEEPEDNFQPVLIDKKTKRNLYGLHADDDDDEDGEIINLDHREFPFSERDAYPKLTVEDALSPGQSTKGGATRLHGRLSVYYSTAPPSQSEVAGASNDEDDSTEDNGDEDDDMTCSGMGDDLFNLDDNEDEDTEQCGVPFAYQDSTSLVKSSTAARRIRPGPPQDTEMKGRKVPPQVQLQKIERIMHRISMKVSVEMVSAPSHAGAITPESRSHEAENHDASNAHTEAFQTKKAVYDEFDKLLGHHERTANPVTRIMSSFIGPLMRMIRVCIYIFRIVFHVSTWRDPFLSFWVLVFLGVLFVILVIFPWRKFFLLLTIALLGPQNFVLRKYLEQKVAEKTDYASDGDASSDGPEYNAEIESQRKDSSDLCLDAASVSLSADAPRRFWPFSREKQTRNQPTDVFTLGAPESNSNVDEECIEETRPAFKSELRGQSTPSRKMVPRAVTIPYSRVKKDRFFDWPPDPFVSRATPMTFREVLPSSEHPQVTSSPRREVDAASQTIPFSNSASGLLDMPRGMRRRMVRTDRYGIDQQSGLQQHASPDLPRFI